MSGSPIIQDGKLVGAVTHVLVNDPTRGYGIFIENMLTCGGKKLAFVGITTPETITSSTPTYFQNENGDYIYGIDGGADGSRLYAAVQAAVDDAEAAGADYIFALAHLGVDTSSGPWTSRNVIANTTGLDAVIDGHSHTTIGMELVEDKAGEPVVLTQTGSYLSAVGKLTISPEGAISSTLLSGEDLAQLSPDAAVAEIEDSWIEEINDSLGTVIGYSEVVLDNYDSEGNRLVRKQSTNSGDFAADALYYLFDEMDLKVDVAVMNGGGIRNGAVSGEYRVKDVQVLNRESGEYEPLDLTATYHLAGHNYTLRDLGGGFDMLRGAVNVLDYVAEDYMVLANYIQSFPVDEATSLPTIRAEHGYEDVNGSGRITILR